MSYGVSLPDRFIRKCCQSNFDLKKPNRLDQMTFCVCEHFVSVLCCDLFILYETLVGVLFITLADRLLKKNFNFETCVFILSKKQNS